MPALRIARADLDAIRAHAREGAPDEVCGVLVGRREGDDVIVLRMHPTANAHAAPRANYLVPPEDLLRIALRAEDEWGLEIVGFYHSHPEGPAHLSATDEARASWPDAAYLLVWLAPDEGYGCWAWREASRAFEPMELSSA